MHIFGDLVLKRIKKTKPKSLYISCNFEISSVLWSLKPESLKLKILTLLLLRILKRETMNITIIMNGKGVPKLIFPLLFKNLRCKFKNFRFQQGYSKRIVHPKIFLETYFKKLGKKQRFCSTVAYMSNSGQ